MSLSPMTIGMVGLGFALWANELQLPAVDAKPTGEGSPSPGLPVAAAGDAMGAATLIFMSLWVVTAAPFGTGPAGVATGRVVQRDFGDVRTAVGGRHRRSASGLGDAVHRQPGPVLLPAASDREGAARPAGIPLTHFALVKATLFSYVLALFGFWRGTHGKIPARLVGHACWPPSERST